MWRARPNATSACSSPTGACNCACRAGWTPRLRSTKPFWQHCWPAEGDVAAERLRAHVLVQGERFLNLIAALQDETEAVARAG